MSNDKPISIEYMCNYCGQKTLRGPKAGKPQPGKCSKRTNNQPHRWVVNRKL